MLASTFVKVLWSASDMSAILVLVIGACRRGAGGQVSGDFCEGRYSAVTQSADERRADDGAVGVLGDSGDLLGGGDADSDAGAVSSVRPQAPDEGAGSAVEFGA